MSKKTFRVWLIVLLAATGMTVVVGWRLVVPRTHGMAAQRSAAVEKEASTLPQKTPPPPVLHINDLRMEVTKDVTHFTKGKPITLTCAVEVISEQPLKQLTIKIMAGGTEVAASTKKKVVTGKPIEVSGKFTPTQSGTTTIECRTDDENMSTLKKEIFVFEKI